MKRVLVIICTAFVPWGGLTTVAMNYYRAMNKENLQIDFASNNTPPDDIVKELENNGSKYIKLPRRSSLLQYEKALFNICKEYDVVDIHGNSATMSLELFPTVLRKVPIRIVHCHTTQPTAKKLSKILRPFFLHMYTKATAVSKEAGDWLYGENNFIVLNNAIQVKKYKFDMNTRIQIRNEINADNDTFVIGNVGKINISKNHSFMLDIFKEIKKQNPNSKLLLVGDGPLKEEIEQKAKQLDIYDDVVFTGMTTTPEKWLNAMDCFLFPSNFEGFGLAMAEAQANGIKCFASDVVPSLADATKTVDFISLSKSAKEWADLICKNSSERMSDDFIDKMFKQAHLDISIEAELLRQIYMED